MPYRSRRKSFGRRRRRTPWYNRKYSTMQLASKALAGVRYLKGLVNSERMSHVKVISGTVPNTLQTFALADIAVGDQDGQRTGNSILAKSILVRAQFTNNSASPNTLYRMMLLQDTQTIADTNTLTITDVLESTSTLAAISKTTAGRFKILKNWFFSTNSVNATQKLITHYHKMHHHIRYNGTATGDIQKGNLYLVFFSDQPTNSPNCTINVKLSYHDN